MDLSYFEQYAPVTTEIVQIIIAAGWALLIGNLVFQAMRSMAAGIGFEGEDPKILFTRTAIFSFLLLASRQICDIGLSLTATVMELMQIPDAIHISTPDESMLGPFDAAWIWMVIIGIILIWQIVKFFFEIGERYVVLAILTVMAPLAFGMGGSKSTEDIFKGWVRMYGSMCVMMLMNVVFLKLLLSAMSSVPSGLGLIPWLVFVVAIARVGRKVDDLVCRVGLNPARTGDPLGRGIPVMVSMMAAKGIGKMLAGTAAANKQGPKPTGGVSGATAGSPRPGPAGPAGNPGGNVGASGSQRGAAGTGTYSSHSSRAQAQQAAAATAAMGGAGAAAGQAAHATGQAANNFAGAHRQPPDAASRQENPAQGGQGGKRSGSPASQTPTRPARTRPVNIDVEYDEADAHTGGGATPPCAAQSPSGLPTAAKAAEQKPTRPPISRTPRGNVPQAPVGAGTSPHSSHSSHSSAQVSSSSTSSQTTQTATDKDRLTIPHAQGQSGVSPPSTQPAAKPVQPPLSGARSTGAGTDRGTLPAGGATRPPIGHNATITSQEPHPPSPGRNGASAPQKPLSPAQGTDGAQSPAPSPGRNSAPQGASPSPRRNGGADRSSPTGRTTPPPSPGRNGAPQAAPQSPGRDGPPQRPPIGHNRKPPQGG